MELTKQDQKQIDKDVDNLMCKIKVEATEYARMYEQAFYTKLIYRIQCHIEATEFVAERIKEIPL